MKKRIMTLFAIMMVGIVLSGCGQTGKKTEDAGKKEVVEKSSDIKKEIVYAIWSAPTGVFNPILADTMYDTAVNDIVYDSLLEFDEDLNLVASIAESYKVSDDNLTFIFKLNPNVKWHDGEPLTANDVKFTFESLANPKYEGDYSSYVASIKGINEFREGKTQELEGIKTIDKNTLQIEFVEIYAPALIQLGTMGILPEHVWKDIAIEEWVNSTEKLNNPIGSGPYKVDEYKAGEYVKFGSLNDYYKGEVKTPTIIFKVANQDTAQAELINGSIDIALMSTLKQKDIDYLKENKIEISSYPNSNIQYMGFNLRKDELKDKNIRQGIAYGLDRQLIVEKLIDGNGVVIDAPMVPSVWAYPEKGTLNDYKRDLNKSKELFKKAGYEDTNGDGYVDKDGKNLKLVLSYPSGDKTRELSAPIIQSQLKEAGVEVELQMMEFSSMMEKVVGNHEFDIYLMANTLGPDPDPKPNWYSTAASDEKGVYGWNISGFKNSDADKLMDEGLKTLDQNQRKEIYRQFGKLMNEELPWVPLYVPNAIKAYSQNFKNYTTGTFLDFQNIQNWYIEID